MLAQHLQEWLLYEGIETNCETQHSSLKITATERNVHGEDYLHKMADNIEAMLYAIQEKTNRCEPLLKAIGKTRHADATFGEEPILIEEWEEPKRPHTGVTFQSLKHAVLHGLRYGNLAEKDSESIAGALASHLHERFTERPPMPGNHYHFVGTVDDDLHRIVENWLTRDVALEHMKPGLLKLTVSEVRSALDNAYSKAAGNEHDSRQR